MKIQGEMVAIGDLNVKDLHAQIVGVPAIQVRLADDRIITIAGLSRDECIVGAEMLGSRVVLQLDLL